MKVILLEDIYKHGVAGEVVEVANGFARNYLIPRGMALPATPSALKRARKLREQAEARRAAYENKLNELARIIDGTELIFGRRAANTCKLFGSVTTKEIAEALYEKTGVDINRRRISQQALREIGMFDVPVRLGTEISPVLKVIIVREEELADFLAERAAEQAEGQEEAPAAEADAPEAIDATTEVIPQVDIAEAVAGEDAEADAEA